MLHFDVKCTTVLFIIMLNALLFYLDLFYTASEITVIKLQQI